MGSTVYHTTRDTDTLVRDCLTGPDCGPVLIEQRGSVYYAACRDRDGVSALVVLAERLGRESVRVRVLHECEGPYYWDASATLLASLNAPRGPHAAVWRDRCRQRAEGASAAQIARDALREVGERVGA